MVQTLKPSKLICKPSWLYDLVLLAATLGGYAVHGATLSSCENSTDAACSATEGQVLLQGVQRGIKVAQSDQELHRAAEEEQLVNGMKMVGGVPIYNYDRRGEANGSSLLEDNASSHPSNSSLEWIVKFADDCQSGCLEEKCQEIGKLSSARCIYKADEGGLSFDVIKATEIEIEAIMKAVDGIVFAEPSIEIHEVPDDLEDEDEEESSWRNWMSWFGFIQASSEENVDSPWNLATLMSETSGDSAVAYAPTFGKQGAGVNVYVVDGGIRASHSEFGGRVIPSVDFSVNPIVECGSDTSVVCADDEKGHGTHVAGTVGGKTVGVAPLATLYSVKVLDKTGTGSSSWFAEAFDWVATHAIKPAVIQASVAANGRSQAIKVAVDGATAAGIAVVVAAGNENDDACWYSPGDAATSITVAAHTKNWKRSTSFSNYGPCVDIYAPGTGVQSSCAVDDNNFCGKTGTSMAAPHVSGVIALLMAQDTSLNGVDAKRLIQEMARQDDISQNAPMTLNQRLFIPAGVPGLPATTTTTTLPTGFLVTEGDCTVWESCVMSPNYPLKYDNLQKCVIKVQTGVFGSQTINVWDFLTENIYDKLWVNGVPYSGTVGPEGIAPTTDIVWQSDYGVKKTGWKLCGSDQPKEPPPIEVARHLGEKCWQNCGGKGYCLTDWCGIGNACCKYQGKNDPPECKLMEGFVTTKTTYQCVFPMDGTPAPTVPTSSPTPYPTLAGAGCKSWCAGHSAPWSEKCTWTIGCGACLPCLTAQPTPPPTIATAAPTSAPTASPTTAPTAAPTEAPTAAPTPTPRPPALACKPWCTVGTCSWIGNCGGCDICSATPSTPTPTARPTPPPTARPTPTPTARPTPTPTEQPTPAPTARPTPTPTELPTPTPPPPDSPAGACKSWCTVEYCSWTGNCGGCDICKPTPPPTARPTLTPTEQPTAMPIPPAGPCKSWCTADKCSWTGHCSGCALCQ